MIVRAVSDSESDDDAPPASPGPRRSVFDPPVAASSAGSGGGARVAWFAACAALVLLLLADLAALLGAANPSVDSFALLPLALAALYQETIILPPLASALNQLAGVAVVGAWIWSRERAMAAGNAPQWRRGGRYGPSTVAALLCVGHAVSCVYLLFALLESNGDRTKFWLGRKRRHVEGKTTPYGRV